jgi:hypothetical protein
MRLEAKTLTKTHLLPLDGCAIHAVILSQVHSVPIIAQIDHLFTLCATRRSELWRVRQFLKIIFIRAVVNINLGFKIITAFFAGFPIPGMSFVEMITAQCVAVMISAATVIGVREQNIFVVVITDPIATTLRFSQIPCFTAQPATGFFFQIYFC